MGKKHKFNRKTCETHPDLEGHAHACFMWPMMTRMVTWIGADLPWRGQGQHPGSGAGKHRAAGPWSLSIAEGGPAAPHLGGD